MAQWLGPLPVRYKMAQNQQPPLKFNINAKCLYPRLIRKSITDQWVVS